MSYYIFIVGFLLIVIGFILTAINVKKERPIKKYRKFVIMGAIMLFTSLIIGMIRSGTI